MCSRLVTFLSFTSESRDPLTGSFRAARRSPRTTVVDPKQKLKTEESRRSKSEKLTFNVPLQGRPASGASSCKPFVQWRERVRRLPARAAPMVRTCRRPRSPNRTVGAPIP